MLRDGMLSPNSKLLPQASRSATPQSMLLGRPGSMMSVASSGKQLFALLDPYLVIFIALSGVLHGNSYDQNRHLQRPTGYRSKTGPPPRWKAVARRNWTNHWSGLE